MVISEYDAVVGCWRANQRAHGMPRRRQISGISLALCGRCAVLLGSLDSVGAGDRSLTAACDLS